MRRPKFRIIMLFLSFFFIAMPVAAATFNPHLLLADDDLENFTTMSEVEIQEFLVERGALGAYVAPDFDGETKTAAAIIARVARTYRLNPQFLLVLIQREQGAIEGRTPTDAHLAWATGFAVCDRCDRDHPELQQFSGFATQLEQAAKRFREKFLPELEATGKTFTGWGPGIGKTVDGVRVTPQNRATAALYTYTPHIKGNRLLWAIWNRWFNRRYPTGSLLKADRGDQTVWFIDRGFARPITSRTALLSRFDPRKIITVPREELALYEEGRPIRFPDYSLLRSPRGTVYLLRADRRHGFPSSEVFRKLGFHEDEIIDVTWDDLALYEEAEPLSLALSYPRGALLQDKTTGGVYFIENGTKYPIWSKEIMKTRFPNRKLVVVTPEELATYGTGEPVKFHDGELLGIQGEPDIFVVSDGIRNPIPSPMIFEHMGWDWKNVIWTSRKAVALHPLGEPITAHKPRDSFATVTTPYPLPPTP